MFQHISAEQEVGVHNNGFALDRMIQGCAMAVDAARLLQALQRVRGFIKSNPQPMTAKQHGALQDMAERQRGRGATWSAEVAEVYDEVMAAAGAEAQASERRRQESRATLDADALAAAAGGGGVAAQVTPYAAVPKGRKVYCRIDRESTVRHRTYRLFLEANLPDVAEPGPIRDSQELFMLSSRKLRTSMKANYHLHETQDCSGEYAGKIRNTSRRRFVTYDGGTKGSAADDDTARKELGATFFDSEDNLNMVHLLMWKPGHTSEAGGKTLHELWDAGRKGDILHMCNKKPTWNDDVGMWSLAFEGEGRVVLASAKNFVLHDPADGEVYMQFGKQDANSFTLDFRHPITPFVAFAFAMSFFEL
eukprot:g5014.t1